MPRKWKKNPELAKSLAQATFGDYKPHYFQPANLRILNSQFIGALESPENHSRRFLEYLEDELIESYGLLNQMTIALDYMKNNRGK